MLKMNGKYGDAKYTFAKFVLRTKDGIYKLRATREIEACDFANSAIDLGQRHRRICLDSDGNGAKFSHNLHPYASPYLLWS